MTTSTSPKNSPTLLVTLPNQMEMVPLPISKFSIDVSILGNFARTKIGIQFYNDSDRVLEGQFVFPLPQGQTISGYALEIDGKFRDAVVVEKAKGRQVFESTIRQKIDPGLLELTRGNVFQSRIYPIPAKGYKSIEVSFEQELSLKENGWAYLLPLQFEEAIEDFSIHIDIPNQEVKPIPYQNEFADFNFHKNGDSYCLDYQAKRILVNQQIGFLIPQERNQKTLIQKKDKDKNYFYMNLIPEAKSRPKKLPANVCLLWDASDSGKKRDLNKELTLLQEYFQKIQNLSLEIVQFSFWIHSSKTFTIQNGNAEEVIQYLKEIQYDGGTQLGALDLSKYKCDEFLLVSDGISNFGSSELKLSDTPLYALNSSSIAEHSYLEYISRNSGGAYLNLTQLAYVDSIQILTNQMYSFLSASFSKDKIQEVYPSLPTIVFKDISFAGIMEGNNAELTLKFGYGKEITYEEKISFSAKDTLKENSFIERIFAQKKILELDLCYKENKEEITRIGKEFSIVTRNTSLIVLDRIEDYVNNRIIPPIELQKEYFDLIKKEEQVKKEEQKAHLDEIANRFQTHIEWWNKEFKYIKEDTSKKKSARPDEFNAGSPAPAMLAQASMEMDREISLPESEEMDRDESISLSEESIVASSMADEPSPEEAKTNSAEEAVSAKGFITLKKWSPDESYLSNLKNASDKDAYAIYLREKENNSNSSAFYLDVADFFLEKNQTEIALRVLSNIAEMNLENHQLLRILGYRLLQIGQWKFAIKIFEDVLEIREEEPQSYRDLALACMADKQYQKALNMFYSVIQRDWDVRFPDIQLIAIHEMNAMIETCKEKLNLEQIDKRFLKNLPVDLRVILTWDADNTDLDLWVTDPNGEKCYYAQNETGIGGRMSNDFREGYGPEEFLLKKAIPGKYSIQANYYGSNQQVLSGTTTIQVTLTTNFGRANQVDKAITMRLKDVKEVVEVGEFSMD